MVTVLGAALSHLILKAYELKKENELTIWELIGNINFETTY
jgi:hypothetical protein